MVCWQANENKKDKYHLHMNSSVNSTVNVDGSIIEKRTCERIFGVNVDYILNSTNTWTVLLTQEGRKVIPLSKVLPYMKTEKRRIFVTLFSCHISAIVY